MQNSSKEFVWPVLLYSYVLIFRLSEMFTFCRLRIEWKTDDCVSLTWGSGQYRVQVFAFPFHVEILYEKEALVTFNPDRRLCFETLSNSAR